MASLNGVCAPICTPFDDSGEHVDETALRRHVDVLVDAGVHIILACGGTGEFAYLRADERLRIAEVTAEHIAGRARFMVQSSAVNTADAIEFTRHAEGLGADAVMILPPYFEGPDLAGVHYHYERIAEAVKIPIMAYNIPQHSGIDIEPDFFRELLEIDNVRYIKDSTADMTRIQALLDTGGTVFNGGDPITYFSLLAGCPGCVWGAVNVMPRQAVELYDLVQAAKLVEARDLWRRLWPAQQFFWTNVYNAAIKAAAALAGMPLGPCRAPVRPLTEAQMTELGAVLERCGCMAR